MNEINVPLLRKVMEHIESHPEEWYQGMWTIDRATARSRVATYRHDFISSELPAEVGDLLRIENSCGTAFCFAGHALFMAGNTVLGERTRSPEGNVRDTHGYAQALLGLTGGQASSLFRGDNSLEDLRRVVDIIIAGGVLV